MSSDSATIPVWDAIAALITGAGAPPIGPNGALLDAPQPSGEAFPRYYRGQVTASPQPDGDEVMPPPGYFLFGQAPEGEGGFLNGLVGPDGEYTIHCWADTTDNANRLYRWLKRLLNEATLTPDGFTIWELTISKGGERSDPAGGAWQVPMYVEVKALDVVV